MSKDIKIKATYKDRDVEFIMPRMGDKIDLDFNGEAMIEAINENGEMLITFRAIDGYGMGLNIKQDDVLFKTIN